jgi:hypothetical protein
MPRNVACWKSLPNRSCSLARAAVGVIHQQIVELKLA